MACIFPIEGLIYLHGHGILLMISAGSILFFALLGTRLGKKERNMSFSFSMLIPRCCVVEVGRFVQLTWIYTGWCSNGCSKQV